MIKAKQISYQAVNFLSQNNPEKNKALRKRAKRNPLSWEAEFQHEHPNTPCSSTWTKAAPFHPCARGEGLTLLPTPGRELWEQSRGHSKCSGPALQSDILWNVSSPLQRSLFPHQETRAFQKLTTFQVPKDTGNFYSISTLKCTGYTKVWAPLEKQKVCRLIAIIEDIYNFQRLCQIINHGLFLYAKAFLNFCNFPQKLWDPGSFQARDWYKNGFILHFLMRGVKAIGKLLNCFIK